MTNLELLNILTNVRGEYILQAQELRSGQRKQQLYTMHRKRVFLIAAIISLLLLLVGCVAAFLGLRDLSLGTFIQDDNFGGTVSGELLSLQGYVGTPEYMATKEWLAFSDNYDPDHKLMDLSAYDDYVEPEAYRIYNCYTREMVEKVDEILEKYQLKIPQKLYATNVEYADICDAVGIEGLFAESMDAEPTLYRGYFYDDGGFHISGNLTPMGSSIWREPVEFSYTSSMKGVFYCTLQSVKDVESYHQWKYTATNGVELLLASSPYDAIIIADKAECFVSVHISGQSMSQETMEALAEVFDFTYTPNAVDMEAADRHEAEQLAQIAANVEAYNQQHRRNTYGDYFADFANSPDLYYSLLHLDDDGVAELATYCAGRYQELFTIKDGYVQKIHEGGYAFANGFSICTDENGQIVFETENHVGRQTYVSYLAADGLDLRYVAFVKYDAVTNDDNPWFVCTNAPGHEVYEFAEMPMFWEPISADEMSNIRDAYTKTELPKKPIGELLADDTDFDISQLTLGSSETALSLFDNILVPLVEGRLPNRAREFKAILERYGYTYRDGEGLFTITDPAHPESYLFGGNSLLYDTDTISTIGFCTETESGKKKVEVYLFTEEQEYYITNPNYTQNKMESFEQLKAYIVQG